MGKKVLLRGWGFKNENDLLTETTGELLRPSNNLKDKDMVAEMCAT